MLSNAYYDAEPSLQVTIRDLSERDQFQQQSLLMSRRDPLTGLFNHQYLREELARFGQSAEQSTVASSLVLIEVENFETIRKALGVTFSDNIVTGLADVIKAQIGADDLLARISDQCFAILLSRQLAEAAMHLAEHVRRAIAEHIWTLDSHSVATTFSIGIASIDANNHQPEEVLTRADRAMRRALEQGGNRVETLDLATQLSAPAVEIDSFSVEAV